jgi:hypothetical protein
MFNVSGFRRLLQRTCASLGVVATGFKTFKKPKEKICAVKGKAGIKNYKKTL